ncbi:MAG: response regulator transcription factor [Lachnospiraceae bacterium]|nr:response regulator transcription factor [Lachnospiraceae bacterium]
MKKVLIVEDSKLECSALVKVLGKIDKDIQVLTTDKLGEALEYAIHNNIHLFIVDIVLNPSDDQDTSGLEFVESIRNFPQYKYVPIIFITGLNDRKLYAYENLHCYRYIQKPLLYSEVEKIIKETLDFTRVIENNVPLKIKRDGVLYVINKKDIIYATSKASKMTIVTSKDRFVFFYLSCTTLMDMLEMPNFRKCNRNTIVNYDYIASIDQRRNFIQLRGRVEGLKIGTNFKKDFLKGYYEIDGMDFVS